jgi:hypothetical protein
LSRRLDSRILNTDHQRTQRGRFVHELEHGSQVPIGYCLSIAVTKPGIDNSEVVEGIKSLYRYGIVSEHALHGQLCYVIDIWIDDKDTTGHECYRLSGMGKEKLDEDCFDAFM